MTYESLVRMYFTEHKCSISVADLILCFQSPIGLTWSRTKFRGISRLIVPSSIRLPADQQVLRVSTLPVPATLPALAQASRTCVLNLFPLQSSVCRTFPAVSAPIPVWDAEILPMDKCRSHCPLPAWQLPRCTSTCHKYRYIEEIHKIRLRTLVVSRRNQTTM